MANNKGPNPDPLEGIDIEALSSRLGGYTESLKGISEQARMALAALPTLRTIEKRKVQINGQPASVSLLEHGGILIDFENAHAAAEHFKNQYP